MEIDQRRRKTLLMVTGCVLFLALCCLIYWWFFVFEKESTDDAYVNGNRIILYSRVPGAVTAYYADNTDLVETGQKLVQLDPMDLQIAFESQQAALAITVREIAQLQQQVFQTEALLKAQGARLEKLKTDYTNRLGLIDSQAISQEELEHARTDLEAAQADYIATAHQLEALKARLGVTPLPEHPQILAAKTNLQNAFLNLSRGTIYAPARGFIAQRTVQVGENVKTDRALMSLFPLEQIWVDANFKERQLRDLRIGQPAEVRADIYGSKVIYKGIVVGLEPGTGSVFSLLPPQNATGNWIKIVQRVPVRILLDAEQVRQFPLLVGLSVYVTIDTSDQTGRMLADKPAMQQQASTPIFDVSLESINALMEQIVQANLHGQ